MGLVLRTGAHQGSPGMRLYSPGLVLHTGAHQGSLGTRIALICTPNWCSLREPGNEASPKWVLCTGAHQGMRLAMSFHSVLVLNRGTWERG